jgi:hypothetical protein
MEVSLWSFGIHPTTNESLGCVTTDSPEVFKLWLNSACPNHQVILEYERSEGAIREEGGHLWRLNVKMFSRKEAVLFKLRWHDNK